MYQGELTSLITKVHALETSPKAWLQEHLLDFEKKVSHLYNLVMMDHARGDVLVAVIDGLRV